MRLLLFERIANFILVTEHKFKVIRPAGVTGDDLWGQSSVFQLLLQFRERALGKLVVLSERVDEAIAAVRAEPDGIARKQILVVDQIHHVSPCMTGAKDTFYLDAVDIQQLTVLQ